MFYVKRKNSTFKFDSLLLKKDNKVLMIKFTKKWDQVYAPPGGKFETGETPLDCIMREFYEETGLRLINPRLQECHIGKILLKA